MLLPKIIFYLLQDGSRSSTPNEVIRAELLATIAPLSIGPQKTT